MKNTADFFLACPITDKVGKDLLELVSLTQDFSNLRRHLSANNIEENAHFCNAKDMLGNLLSTRKHKIRKSNRSHGTQSNERAEVFNAIAECYKTLGLDPSKYLNKYDERVQLYSL